MDDWNYYSNELSHYFEKMGIESFYPKKRYLTFEIENGKKIQLIPKVKSTTLTLTVYYTERTKDQL